MTRVDLSAEHRQIVLAILRTHLPQDANAWVSGSRATGRARLYSDLDLAVDAGRRLTLDERASLTEAFTDSDLPYKSILSIGRTWMIAGGRRSQANASL